MAKYLVLILSILATPLISKADLLVEPGIFFARGDHSIAWPSPLSSSTGSTTGTGFDLKLGYEFAGLLYVAGEGSFAKPNFKNSAVSYDATATDNIYGVVVGAQMPIVGLRVWGGYMLGGVLDPSASNGYDVKFSEGSGLKLGAGFHFLLVSLNLEYMNIKYNSSKLEMLSGVGVNQDLSEKLENKTLIVSVSMPLSL